MAERNSSETQKQCAESAHQLPPKIEQRLADLARLGEFDHGDVQHCRATYWSARGDWHKILIDCYDQAQQHVNVMQPNMSKNGIQQVRRIR